MPTNAINDTGVKYIYDKLDAKKVEKEPGKGLSTNDYSNTDKAKVDKIDTTTTSISGNPISISGLKSNQLAINPIITFEPIQAGSGTPSPSNIRAISGYDKIEVLTCGVNIWDEQWEVGTYDRTTGNPVATSSNIRSKSTNPIIVGGNTTYYWNCKNGCRAFFYDGKGNYLGNQAISNAYSTFTTPTNAAYMRFHVAGEYGTTYGNNIAVNYPATLNEYVPHHKTTDLSESLGQTVYGGEYDVRTGKARVTWNYMVLDGSSDENWSLMVSGSFLLSGITPQKTYYTGIPAPISDRYFGKIISGWGDLGIYEFAFHPTNYSNVRFNDPRYTTLDAWKAYLQSNPMYIAYLTNIPTEIQLTPHEIALSQGYNYISTNGSQIDLAYHNGELASLADVEQAGETINALGQFLLNSKFNLGLGLPSGNVNLSIIQSNFKDSGIGMYYVVESDWEGWSAVIGITNSSTVRSFIIVSRRRVIYSYTTNNGTSWTTQTLVSAS